MVIIKNDNQNIKNSFEKEEGPQENGVNTNINIDGVEIETVQDKQENYNDNKYKTMKNITMITMIIMINMISTMISITIIIMINIMITIMIRSIIRKAKIIIIMITMIIMATRTMEEKRTIKEGIMIIMIMIMGNHIKRRIIIKADINKNMEK